MKRKGEEKKKKKEPASLLTAHMYNVRSADSPEKHGSNRKLSAVCYMHTENMISLLTREAFV